MLSVEMEEQQRDPLALPSPEVLRQIAEKQDAKEKEILDRKRTADRESDERDDAAKLIQKNYRGYRTRRALEGRGLDSNSRWMEV
jgi:hypothetical protein